jgi:hypothetical protein
MRLKMNRISKKKLNKGIRTGVFPPAAAEGIARGAFIIAALKEA